MSQLLSDQCLPPLLPFALVPIVLFLVNGMSQGGRTHGSRPYVGVGDVNTYTESERVQGQSVLHLFDYRGLTMKIFRSVPVKFNLKLDDAIPFELAWAPKMVARIVSPFFSTFSSTPA